MYGRVSVVTPGSLDLFMCTSGVEPSDKYYTDLYLYLTNLLEYGEEHDRVMYIRKRTVMESAVIGSNPVMESAVIGSNPVMTVHSEWRLIWVGRDVYREHRHFLDEDIQRESLWDVNSVTVERAAGAIR